MKKNLTGLILIFISFQLSAQSFTLESVTSYPFVSEIATSANQQISAFSVNQKGMRNIYVANGPQFSLKKLTNYDKDYGEELTSLNVSNDGKFIVFVKGGDHGAFVETIPRNPGSLPDEPKVQIFSISLPAAKPVLLGDGDYPVISPDNKSVVFIKNHEAWIAPVDGSKPAKLLFYCFGNTGSVQFSPDGSMIAFVTSRGDHSFIGIYRNEQTPIQYLSPAFARDVSPRWSPDGKEIVFVRRPVPDLKSDSITIQKIQPWSVRIADIASGKSRQIWQSPRTLQGSVPASSGRYNLNWAANNRIVFLSYQDGWPHLYSVDTNGGEPLLLTPGAFNVEQIKLSPDKKWLLFSTNTGKDKEDLDRRHLAKVSVDKADMQMLTEGEGIESTPHFSANGKKIIYLSATAQRPTLPAVLDLKNNETTLIGENLIPADFPANKLAIPKSVQFKAEDGKTVYGQLFEPTNISGKKPAVLFVHGGPQRQMLLGWHYMDYYANTYGINQYLVSKGFVVLSVNYRLGIGYGYDFQHPVNAAENGASEYKDIKAAGEWLASQSGIDENKIGIYGGSYGGYLTAMALARDSKLFAAGVDISGMHNLLPDLREYGYEKPVDLNLAKKLTWKSSPDAYLDTWTSLVLIISGDDDGNVPFSQSVDLVKRFEEKGFPFESLVVPDETHHWMKYANMLKMDQATADFLERKLRMKEDDPGK